MPVNSDLTEVQVGEFFTTLSNWGKWGPNDQFGALNYNQISVVPEANILSAPEGPPSPKPTGTAAPQLSPPC